MADLKILFIGDIVGSSGRQAVAKLLPALKQQYNPDYIIANGENAAAGFGITKSVYEELVYDLNINVLTTGNHIWDKKELKKDIDTLDKLLRPLNYPECRMGVGYKIDKVKDKKICTISLMGRTFISYVLEDPFRTMDKILEELKDKADIFIIDFHAEVTSEKKALGFYLDGRVSALLGTHTHIQTADAMILPKGTGYMTDVGMVGVVDSVLGMDKNIAIDRFLYGINERFDVAEGKEVELDAVYLEIDSQTNLTKKIERISRIIAL